MLDELVLSEVLLRQISEIPRIDSVPWTATHVVC